MKMRLYVLSAAFVAAFTLPAHAYLDPGTGSMILQGILGAIAVAGAVVSVYWNKLKLLVSSVFARKK